MVRPTVCPHIPQLRRLLLGQAPPEVADALETHVLECPSCLETMRSLQAEDPLIEAVRWRPTTNHGAGAETIQRLIQRLKRLHASAGAPATPAPQPDTPMLHQTSAGARPEQAPAPPGPPLPERIGRYSILARLGRGGMGTVYKAYDPQLQRVVAVKVPHFHWLRDHEEVARRRFLREARAAAAVRHPNVCPIYDVAEHDGDPYVVMAYVEGGSLGATLTAGDRPVDTRQAVTWARQVADALAAVHACGVVHRDLKPSNILIDAAGNVVLADFGLARAEQSSEQLTVERDIIGTPGYMAPEQASGHIERVGPQSDLYTLGVILYQMLAGRLPFQGPALSVIYQVVHEVVPPPSQFRPDLDGGLEAIITKAMSRHPQDRFASAAAFAEALAGWLATAAPAALPQPASRPAPSEADTRRMPLPQGRGSTPRRRAALTVVASLLLLLGAGLLLQQIIIRIKTRDGQETTIQVPTGSEIQIKEGGTVTATPPGRAGPAGHPGLSPLDKLDPKEIPPLERRWQPQELVAVIGEHRRRHWGNILGVAFSPDGKLLASGGVDGVVRLWDVATMRARPSLRPVQGFPGLVTALAFSPNGRTLACSTTSGTTHLWNLTGPEPEEWVALGQKGQPDDSNPRGVGYSPDSKTLITGSNDGMLLSWDLSSRRPTERARLKGPGGLIAWTLAPDGQTLAAGANDGTVRIIDLSGGQPAAPVAFAASVGRVSSMAFFPTGKMLAVGGDAATIRFWDATGPAPKMQGVLRGSCDGRSLAIAADGRTLAAGKDRNVYLFALDKLEEPAYATIQVSSPVQSLAFTLDGKTLACGEENGSLRLWDVTKTTPKELLPFDVPRFGSDAMALAPDGTSLACAYTDGAVQLWDLTRTAPKAGALLRGHTGYVTALAFASEGRSLASASIDATVRLWDVVGPEPKVRAVLRGHSGAVHAVALASGGKTLASGGEDKTVRLWDIGVEPAKQTAVLRGHVAPVRWVAFDADTTSLASLSDDGSLRLWDLSGAEPREAAVFHGSPGYQALAFAPVGRVLAYGTGDEIRLCRLAGTKWAEQQFCKTGGPAICLAFAPDGRTLASANGGAGLNVWQIATANRLQRWLLPGPAWRVAVAPDGRHLAVGDQFGTVYILRLSAAELGGNRGVPPASGPRP
jgi:WD40 repeat protein/serine/threonine protein kinase